MSNDYPATKRWLADVGADRRRAYDARKRTEGKRRVNVMVPGQHVEKLKTFARFLRNCPEEAIEHYRQQLEEYQRDAWREYDAAVASGNFDPSVE